MDRPKDVCFTAQTLIVADTATCLRISPTAGLHVVPEMHPRLCNPGAGRRGGGRFGGFHCSHLHARGPCGAGEAMRRLEGFWGLGVIKEDSVLLKHVIVILNHLLHI